VALIFSGQVILGATLSTTVTVKLQAANARAAGIAGGETSEQVTVVVPTGKNEPD
jgi:hypothetical protein